ncbi:MAG: hypothetical protein KDK97_04240, partial [Verrucomicrobiales bacterium]|nr:hypothetical protein [Verrucomicrobiales bacterium]
MNHTRLLCALSAILILASTASAHHGQDFLIVQDVQLPKPGSLRLVGNFEWESYETGDEFGLIPGVMVGVMDRLALAVDVHFRDEAGSNWNYSNITPAVFFDLTPSSDKFPFKIGLTAGYQFANSSSADPAMDREEEEEHGDHHHADEEETGHAHTHGGSIHNHDSDAFTSRLILET